MTASGGAPKQLIVFLHGYGASGDDLIGHAPYFSAVLPDAAFLSPHAPHPTDMGFGYQWFSLRGWQPGMEWPAGAWDEIVAHGKMLNAWLDSQLEKFSLSPAQLALVGFSQGTMMALHTALRRPSPIGGVVGFSGALLQAEKLPADITARPPVLLVHGDADPIVEFAEMKRAEDALRANAVPVQTLARAGLPHSIDDAGLMAAVQFAARSFGA